MTEKTEKTEKTECLANGGAWDDEQMSCTMSEVEAEEKTEE